MHSKYLLKQLPVLNWDLAQGGRMSRYRCLLAVLSVQFHLSNCTPSSAWFNHWAKTPKMEFEHLGSHSWVVTINYLLEGSYYSLPISSHCLSLPSNIISLRFSVGERSFFIRSEAKLAFTLESNGKFT